MQSIPVTVIALCYNHERFLIECLESIRSQTFQNFQLIVTNDYSTDGSSELIAAWLKQHYPSAIYLNHQANIGICRTLNEAISHASGEYISMIATDDVWEPEKIEKQLSVMQNVSKNVVVAYSDALQIDENSDLVSPSFIDAHLHGKTPPTGDIFDFLVARPYIPAMATLIRREAILAVGGYDSRLIYEDYDMWLRLAEHHEFIFIPGHVAKYRIVSSSMVRSKLLLTNPNYVYSECLIREKLKKISRLSSSKRYELEKFYWEFGYILYCLDDRRAIEIFMKSKFYRKKFKSMILAVILLLGMNRTRLKAALLFFR